MVPPPLGLRGHVLPITTCHVYISTHTSVCFTFKSRHPVLFCHCASECLITSFSRRTLPVARNPHDNQHVLDPNMPLCSMIWRRSTLPSGFNRFSENRLKPAEKKRFYPVFCFDNSASLCGFVFVFRASRCPPLNPTHEKSSKT